MITVNAINMYTVIDDYHQSLLMESIKINTKYKTVGKKIKPVVIPLPEDSWQKMKEVANNPNWRDRKKIAHYFTEETKGNLWFQREHFLLPKEERKF